MDSLTHIVLGAAVGETTLGNKIGNKALIWGAIAGSFPDFDVMVSYKNDRAISLHSKGDLVGLSVGVVPSVYKGTAVALTEGELLAISRQDLVDLIQGHNELGDKIMKKMSAVAAERSAIVDGDGPKESGS